jgi:hypothetical protein
VFLILFLGWFFLLFFFAQSERWTQDGRLWMGGITLEQKQFLIERIDHALDTDPKIREIIASNEGRRRRGDGGRLTSRERRQLGFAPREFESIASIERRVGFCIASDVDVSDLG